MEIINLYDEIINNYKVNIIVSTDVNGQNYKLTNNKNISIKLFEENTIKLVEIKSEKDNYTGVFSDLSKEKLELATELLYPLRHFIIRQSKYGEMENIENFEYDKQKWELIKAKVLMEYEPVGNLKQIIKETEENIINKNRLKDDFYSRFISDNVYSLYFLPIYGIDLNGELDFYLKHTFVLGEMVYFRTKGNLDNDFNDKENIKLKLRGWLDGIKTNLSLIGEELVNQIEEEAKAEFDANLNGEIIINKMTGKLIKANLKKELTFGNNYKTSIQYEVELI